jgi:hypothetical protein
MKWPKAGRVIKVEYRDELETNLGYKLGEWVGSIYKKQSEKISWYFPFKISGKSEVIHTP